MSSPRFSDPNKRPLRIVSGVPLRRLASSARASGRCHLDLHGQLRGFMDPVVGRNFVLWSFALAGVSTLRMRRRPVMTAARCCEGVFAHRGMRLFSGCRVSGEACGNRG